MRLNQISSDFVEEFFTLEEQKIEKLGIKMR